MRIDAHQSFWLYEEENFIWMTEEMSLLKRNFLPNDISQTLKDNNIDGLVAIQLRDSWQETNLLIELSQVYKVIKGIVGVVDLCSSDIVSLLENYSKYPIIKGFSHVTNSLMHSDYLIHDDYQRGIETLTRFNYVFELRVEPNFYASILNCVKNNPNQKFMFTDILLRNYSVQEFEDWKLFVEELSKFSNAYCKIPGLSIETKYEDLDFDTIDESFSHIVRSFGSQRVCFGSGWPMSLLSGTYEESLHLLNKQLGSYDIKANDNFWGQVATDFYGLE